MLGLTFSCAFVTVWPSSYVTFARWTSREWLACLRPVFFCLTLSVLTATRFLTPLQTATVVSPGVSSFVATEADSSSERVGPIFEGVLRADRDTVDADLDDKDDSRFDLETENSKEKGKFISK